MYVYIYIYITGPRHADGVGGGRPEKARGSADYSHRRGVPINEVFGTSVCRRGCYYVSCLTSVRRFRAFR
jgi:hypothetical protein